MRANHDNHVLLSGQFSAIGARRHWRGFTTTITIVEWPRENQRPQVTGNCPRLIKLRVALSMALAGYKDSRFCVK
jgi:hypothetical protein